MMRFQVMVPREGKNPKAFDFLIECGEEKESKRPGPRFNKRPGPKFKGNQEQTNGRAGTNGESRCGSEEYHW